jgi:hypothetical protein
MGCCEYGKSCEFVVRECPDYTETEIFRNRNCSLRHSDSDRQTRKRAANKRNDLIDPDNPSSDNECHDKILIICTLLFMSQS